MKRRFFPFGLVFVACMVLAGGARAQSVLNTPAAAGKSSEPAGITDHELVVKQIGIRVVHWGKMAAGAGLLAGNLAAGGEDAPAVNPNTTANLSLTTIGVRTWLTKRIGIDGGIGLFVHKPTAGANQFGMGFAGGVPIALGWFKHITIYAEPRFNLSFMRVAKDVIPVTFGLAGDLGAELSFGWIGIPRLAVQFAIGLELLLQYDGDKTDLVIATRDFLDTLAYNFGLTYYF
jgi:hypothetical protein